MYRGTNRPPLSTTVRFQRYRADSQRYPVISSYCQTLCVSARKTGSLVELWQAHLWLFEKVTVCVPVLWLSLQPSSWSQLTLHFLSPEYHWELWIQHSYRRAYCLMPEEHITFTYDFVTFCHLSRVCSPDITIKCVHLLIIRYDSSCAFVPYPELIRQKQILQTLTEEKKNSKFQRTRTTCYLSTQNVLDCPAAVNRMWWDKDSREDVKSGKKKLE